MKIQSNTIIKDSFELEGKTIPFTLHLTQMGKDVYKKRAELGSKLEKSDEDLEGFASTIVEMYELIFGESVTNELMEYYEGDAFGMLLETLPVLTEIVFPALDRLRSDSLGKKMRLKQNG